MISVPRGDLLVYRAFLVKGARQPSRVARALPRESRVEWADAAGRNRNRERARRPDAPRGCRERPAASCSAAAAAATAPNGAAPRDRFTIAAPRLPSVYSSTSRATSPPHTSQFPVRTRALCCSLPPFMFILTGRAQAAHQTAATVASWTSGDMRIQASRASKGKSCQVRSMSFRSLAAIPTTRELREGVWDLACWGHRSGLRRKGP